MDPRLEPEPDFATDPLYSQIVLAKGAEGANPNEALAFARNIWITAKAARTAAWLAQHPEGGNGNGNGEAGGGEGGAGPAAGGGAAGGGAGGGGAGAEGNGAGVGGNGAGEAGGGVANGPAGGHQQPNHNGAQGGAQQHQQPNQPPHEQHHHNAEPHHPPPVPNQPVPPQQGNGERDALALLQAKRTEDLVVKDDGHRLPSAAVRKSLAKLNYLCHAYAKL